MSLCQERIEISMFLKRIVSAVSALTIAVSTFAGLTLTASAVGVPTVYNVTYKTEISQVEVGEKNDVSAEEYNILKKAGTSYTGNDEKQYIVISDDAGAPEVEVVEAVIK